MNLPALQEMLSAWKNAAAGGGEQKSARTVDETQNTGRLFLLVGPSATLSDHRFGPNFERLAGLKRSVVAAAGNLVRVRVTGPMNLLKLTLTTEDDEVVATG